MKKTDFLKKILWGVACFLLLAAWQTAAASEIAPGNTRPFAIKNVRIFDGVSMLTENTILVENGVISELGQFGVMEFPPGTEIIDGTGHTVVPGLIDCHTHIYDPVYLKDPELELRKALVFGVTTELDMMTDPAVAARIKKLKADGRGRDMADIFTSGFMLTSSGGHGTEYGIKNPPPPGPGEMESWIDARIKEGSDYIKICLEDGKACGLNYPIIDRAILSDAIRATHERHRLAIVHAGSVDASLLALVNDIDGLAHLIPDREPPKNFGAVVRSHNTFVIPTLTVLESICGIKTGLSLVQDSRIAPYLSEADIYLLNRAMNLPGCTIRYEYAREGMRQLMAAGVPILAGTDAAKLGTVHGASMHRELEMLLDSGLTHKQVLAAATSVPAKIFGLDDRGRIAPEFRADLVMVKGDPTDDIRATRAIVRVWKDGIETDREAYRKSLETSKGKL
ncbi:MAG: amidohydrolase family protein [Candidatus Xenobiia bacterium LiM19]